jgi:hypothetical protein
MSNLAELRGGVLLRVKDPHKIHPAALDAEINHSINDIFLKMREDTSYKISRITTIPILADKDMYPLPKGLLALLHVERLDAGAVPVSVQKVDQWSMNERARQGIGFLAQRFSYSPVGGKFIRLLEKPSNSVDPGIRYTYIASPDPLVNDKDEPEIPDAIHETIIPRAIYRLTQHWGIELAAPRTFAAYKREMDERLASFIKPDEIDQPADIHDEDVFYPGGIW